MTSPRMVARMVDGAVRKAAVGRARSAQVRFTAQGIPDLITFADGSSTPPLFATHTSTLLPGGASPAGLTLPMLVVPLDGGGWVPVGYMPTSADYLVETTVRLPVQTVWEKSAPDWTVLTWPYQTTRTGPSAQARQGWHGMDDLAAYPLGVGIFAGICHFGSLPALIPSGATVHAVKLALTRIGGTELDQHTAIRPWVAGHRYTPAAPPVAGSPPVAVAGRTIEGAPMDQGDTQQIDLWATDLMTGALTGITFGGTPSADGATYGDIHLLVTYTGGIAA